MKDEKKAAQVVMVVTNNARAQCRSMLWVKEMISWGFSFLNVFQTLQRMKASSDPIPEKIKLPNLEMRLS